MNEKTGWQSESVSRFQLYGEVLIQIVLFQPVDNEVGNLCVVQFLEHEMTVAGDALVRKVDDSGIPAVGIIVLRKIAALP